jgi:hypothetical protein
MASLTPKMPAVRQNFCVIERSPMINNFLPWLSTAMKLWPGVWPGAGKLDSPGNISSFHLNGFTLFAAS